jgi:hypothetical protein
MQILETDYWLCELPPEWQAEQEDDSVIIVDEDEVSTIEISTLKKSEGDVSEKELREFAGELFQQGLVESPRKFGPFKGFGFNYSDEEGAWREWFLACGQLMLFVTHGCLPEHKGMDDGSVDEILDSLLVK